MKSISLVIVLVAFLLGCVNNNNQEEKQTPLNDIANDDVGYIEVSKENSNYVIGEGIELYEVLSTLKNSHIEYIKFGSKNAFTIYSKKGEKIAIASYRDNLYKIEGVVYQAEHNIFN